MRYYVVVAVIIFFAPLLAPAASTLAQDAERGTTLVCYAGGGDAISVEEWTPEQVADYEPRTGHDVARWFFGSDRAFVEEQIARFAGS
jgi:hypothetical protein